MTRKQFLLASAGAAASPVWAVPRTQMGIATTCYLTVWRPKDTYEFLEHCEGLGAGGIQASLASTDPAYVKKLRTRAEQAGMYLEFMIGLPKEDTLAFEATVRAAKEAGALCLRANCLPGRRYETFTALEGWRRLNGKAYKATVGTVTNDSGAFEMPYLLPGVYTVTIEIAGFKKAVRESVQLRIGERVSMSAKS